MATAAKPAKPAHKKTDHVQINLGLQILYPTEPSTKITLDIVALPGLGASPEFTWIKDKVHWLRDTNMLPRKVDDARISVFQYQSQWFGKGAVDQRLENVADQLLYHLDRLRGETNKTPIVFISHCLGGIVLERALITSRLRQNDFPSIFPSIAGCIFLGTPFKGTKTQSKAMVLAGMAETVGMGVTSSLLKLLEDGSDVLKSMLDEFVRLVNDAQIRVVCFFESEKSDLSKVVGLPFMKNQELIVDKESATWPGVASIQLNSDHFKLNKYSGPKDGNFVSVSNEIKLISTKAPGIMRVRQKAVRQALINDRTYHALIDTLGRGFADLTVTTKGSYTGPAGAKSSWIVEVDEYKKWREQDTSRLLWIHGKAGTGQGAIASSVIETLDEKTKEESTIVASFFCEQSDENRRSLRSMLKLLIRQIIDIKQDLAVHLLTDSKSKKKGGKQDFDPEALNKIPVLWEALQSMAKDLAGGCINLVIYGIDQLSKDSLVQFLEYIKDMPDKGVSPDEDAEGSPIKWLLLSRSGRPEIEKLLKSKAHEINIDDSEHTEFVSDALRASISARVDEIGLAAPLGYFVKRHIHSRAEDNYIYTNLALQELKNALASGMSTHSEIRALLESMPFGLTDMFEHIRNRILSPTADGIEYTKEILRCRILARRAPTLRELAIMADIPEEDREDLERLKSYLIRCGAFVELRGNDYDEDSMTVEWIDISAQEHLEKYARDALALEPDLKEMQHGIIALRCLNYVYWVTEKYEAAEAAKRAKEEAENGDTHDDQTNEDQTNEDQTHEDQQNEVPLAETHAEDVEDPEVSNDEKKENDEQDEEHHNDEGAPETDVAPMEENDPESGDSFSMEDALRYPVEYWLEHAKLAPLDVIEEFRTGHAFWNEDSPARQDWWSVVDSLHVLPNQTNVSPLHVATIAQFSGLVDHLLKYGWGDDIHQEDSYGCQPLFCACSVGNYEIAVTLIGAGAEIDYLANEENVAALHVAAQAGHLEIVECLLERDADINLNNKESGSALYVACEENHTAVVRLLVERKANVNLVGGYSFRPINIAAWHGNEEVVRLLLENGAEIDPEQPEYWYGSALGAACRRGHVEVVKLLLSKGWSPTRAMKTYGSFLACAAAYGHLEVVEILLENEARITVLEQALVAASQGGKTSVVKAILAHSPTPRHQKAFMRAADNGRDEILELLFPRGIPPEMLDAALYTSADREHESTVKLLLQFGASPNAEGPVYGCALSASAYDGTTEIMKLLVENGADVNKRGGEYGNPLQAAAWCGDAENVKYLLDHGAVVNTEPVGKYGHALQATSDAKTIRLLLEHGADVNAYGGEYGYAIIGAVEEGDSEAVKIFLEYNADVKVRGANEHSTPIIVTAGLTLPLEDLETILDRGADVNAADDMGTTALINCADAGDEDGLRFLLGRGANVHSVSEKLGTALHAAAKNGDEGCCKILLDAGSYVDATGGPDGTPLQAAASIADLETVQMLLEAGANATGEGLICGTFGTPLQAACAAGDLTVSRELVEHGGVINFHPANGKHGYPLHAAAASGNEEIVSYLLENGADVTCCGGEHGYALIAAAQVPWNYSVVQLLLDHGADASAQAGVLGNAAAAAASVNNSVVLQALIDAGASPHAMGGKYGSVLQAASVKASDLDCVDILLNLSVNVNAIGGKYHTALTAAAYHGRFEVVEKLLDSGADFRIRGGKYMSPVAAAAMRGHKNVLEKFLSMGPPEQILDEALVEACAHRQATSVELLLKSGAHVYARHPTLGTAMDALKAEQAEGWNSDDEQEEAADEEEEEDDDDDEDGEDDEWEGDDESDGDGSVLDLQLEDEVSEDAKIQKLLDDAMARVKRNPSVKRFRTVKRGGLPASLKAGGPPQMPPRPSFQQYGPPDPNGFNGSQPQFQQQFSASPRQSFQAYPGPHQQAPGHPPQNLPSSTAPPYRQSVGSGSQPTPYQAPQGAYQAPSYPPQFRPSPTGSPSRKPVANSYQQAPSAPSSNPATPPRQHSNGPSPVHPPQLPPRTESHENQRYSAQQPGRPPLNPGPGGRYQQQQPQPQSQRQSYGSPQFVPAYGQSSPQQPYNGPHPQGSYTSHQPTYNNPPPQAPYGSSPQPSYTQPQYNAPPPAQQYNGAPQYASPPPSQYQAFNAQPFTQPPAQGSGYGPYGQQSQNSSQTSFQSSQYANSSQYAGSQQAPGVYGTPNSSQASGLSTPGQAQNQVPVRKWASGGYDGEGYG